MSLINLNKRVTNNWHDRSKYLKSPESLIYVKDRPSDYKSNPASMEVQVGDVYILPGQNMQYKIPKEGISISAKQSIVIYSKQKFAIPYNAFGLVTGKGNYIFQGCFISSGKIDPGFDGYLKIGFYNGSNKTIILKQGDSFASVFFINTEFTMENALEDYQSAPPADTKPLKYYKKILNSLQAHWVSLLAWIVVAIPTAIYYIIQIIDYFSKK